MSSQETSPKPEAEIHYASRGSSYFDVLLAVFCVVLVVSNIAATKGTEFFSGDVSLGPVQIIPLFSDGGAVLFPLAYIIGDVISEVYGLKAARRAIFVGFGTAIMAFVTFLIVIQLPSASFYENQEAFESVVWSGVQIVAASLIAYVVGQFLNSYVLVRMKARIGGARVSGAGSPAPPVSARRLTRSSSAPSPRRRSASRRSRATSSTTSSSASSSSAPSSCSSCR